MTNQWTSPNDALPDRGKPVLCAWKLTTKWEYAIAKWTGKRWLDVVPETTNEEYRTPYYWQEIQSPDSAVEPTRKHALDDVVRLSEEVGGYDLPVKSMTQCEHVWEDAPHRDNLNQRCSRCGEAR